MRNVLRACLTTTLFAASAAAAEPSAPVVVRGLVSLVDDVMVPAPRAGVVRELAVKEGDQVEKDALLAQIDDEQSKLEMNAARVEREAAEAKGQSDVDVRFAEATHLVAEAEHRKGLEANQKVRDALSDTEIDRLKLAADQALLRIEASQHERKLKGLDSKVFGAKEELAKLDVRRRQVTAPIPSIVAERFVRAGEWIEPGKPIVRLVRLERLRVEMFVRVAERLPSEIVGRPVTVSAVLARDRRESFAGRITFVSPLVQPGGDYRVWAEVDNRRDGDQWLLRPGLEVEVAVSP